MSRRTRIVLGASLVVVGLTGMLGLGSALPLNAQPADSTHATHETTDVMMNAVQDHGTSDRTHQIPGAEEMMEQCSSMMTAMGGGMMGEGMMGGGMMGG